MTETDLTAAFNENNAPFARTMGVKMTSVTKERIEAELEVTPDHCTIPATLHGGAIMAFADNLGGIGAFLNMPEGSMTSTIESKTNFLRPVPVGEKAFAVTTPVNIGRTLQVWKTEITREDGKLAAGDADADRPLRKERIAAAGPLKAGQRLELLDGDFFRALRLSDACAIKGVVQPIAKNRL